jgi:hypothetical protein
LVFGVFGKKTPKTKSLGQFSLGGCFDYEEVTKATQNQKQHASSIQTSQVAPELLSVLEFHQISKAKRPSSRTITAGRDFNPALKLFS